MSDARSVARAAAGMGVATAVSRLFGFLRVLVVAAVLGTTFLGNTFQATNSFSNVLFELLAAGALSAVLVPTFVELIDGGREHEAERLAGNLLTRALVALGALTVAGIVAAPWIARLLSTGVDDPAVGDAQRDLATYLLRFFVPQVMLYAIGTVAIAALYAKRRFAITAAAPIANSIVLIAAMLVFRALVGAAAPGFDLSTGERLTLALGGTVGVAAYVAVPAVALWRSGFHLTPRFQRRDPAVQRLARLSVWAVLQHAEIGILLGTAIVVGNAVEGGVLAYQVAFVFFLAPYAVLAQPILTAILPELAAQAGQGDLDGFARSLRWSLSSMARLVAPVTAAMLALALPGMTVVAFGRTDRAGVGLLAAGVASLATGIFFYGAFLLLARAYYALGDSRTPAVVAVTTALAGVAVMVAMGGATHGAARVAALGIGHTAAYLLGVVVLAVGLSRRTGHAIVPTGGVRAVLASATLGAAAWWTFELLAPEGRLASLLFLAVTGAAGAVVYVAAVRGADAAEVGA